MGLKSLIIIVSMSMLLAGFQNCSKMQKGVGFSTTSSTLYVNGEPVTLITDTLDVERFPDKVDVLIVVDNSGSMRAEQASMASRFSNFISKLDNLDWHLGIITTDVAADAPRKQGRLVEFNNTNHDFFLSSDMPRDVVESAFANTITLGVGGSSSEQGIAATSYFIDRYSDMAAVNNTHRSMLRADAALAVIVVSDQDESKSAARNIGTNLIAKIQSVFGPSKKFIFNSIIVKDGDTACRASNEGYGTKYQDFSILTGGVVGSVCAADYTEQLQIIGEATASLVNSIQLSCVPQDVDQDGTVDVTLKTSAGNPILDFTVAGQQVRLTNALAPGSYSVSYYCK